MLSSGVRIGPYEIVSSLGAGGMGEVYRARDPRLKRDVAIKVLPDLFAHDPERLARFEREAHVLAALNHPHIAQVYGFEVSVAETKHASRALVMELVEGETLADRLARASGSDEGSSKLPIDEALEIARQIADALTAAHARGIVHRDLKPANIKIRPDGTVKVLDFGLANWPAGPAAVDAVNSPTITSPAMTVRGTLIGTASYMSPEQAKGKQVDKRADIWAFGCVLYEMLSGRRLFDGESITEVLAAVIKDPPDWSALPRQTPASVRRVLSRCLERDVRRRLHDIADARIELEDAIAAPGREAHVVDVSPPAPPWRVRPREIVAWLALAALLGATVRLGSKLLTAPPPAASPLTRVSIVHRGTTIAGPPQISPDGRRVTYVARNREGMWQIWVRELDALEPRPLAGTADFYPFGVQPFWSPDSRDIGFFDDRALKRVPAAGGAVQVVATGADIVSYGGAWASNNTIVYAPQDLVGLMRVASDGGPVTPATTLPTDGVWVHFWPSFLPDGRRFLFTAKAWNRSLEEGRAGIFLGSLDSRETVRLLPDVSNAVYAAPGFILFVRDGMLTAAPFDADSGRVTGATVSLGEPVTVHAETQLGAFSVSQTNVIALRRSAPLENVGQLQWIDRSGTIPPDPVGSVRAYGDRAVSPDGQWIAAAIMDPRSGSSDIWVIGADGSERRLTASREVENAPTWSPDSSRLAYLTTTATGTIGVHVRRLDGSDPSVLIDWREPGLLVPQAWSPDGRHLLLCRVATPNRAPDLMLWSFDTKALTPFLETPALECGAKFSPDGQWVTYGAQEDAGPMETFVARFPKATDRQRIATSAGPVSWRADGREILTLTSSQDLVAVPVTIARDQVRSSAPVILLRRLDHYPWTTPDHARILVYTRPDPEQGVAEIQLITGWQEKVR
jgi:Tol biopolymer transport system component